MGKYKHAKSIGSGMRHVREWAGYRTHESLAKAIKARGKSNIIIRTLNFKTGTSKKMWCKFENSKSRIKLRHFQLLSYCTGVCLGPFFVSTHVVSRLKKINHSPNQANVLRTFAQGLRQLARTIDDLVAAEVAANSPTFNEQEAFYNLFDAWKSHGVVAEKFVKPSDGDDMGY